MHLQARHLGRPPASRCQGHRRLWSPSQPRPLHLLQSHIACWQQRNQLRCKAQTTDESEVSVEDKKIKSTLADLDAILGIQEEEAPAAAPVSSSRSYRLTGRVHSSEPSTSVSKVPHHTHCCLSTTEVQLRSHVGLVLRPMDNPPLLTWHLPCRRPTAQNSKMTQRRTHSTAQCSWRCRNWRPATLARRMT